VVTGIEPTTSGLLTDVVAARTTGPFSRTRYAQHTESCLTNSISSYKQLPTNFKNLVRVWSKLGTGSRLGDTFFSGAIAPMFLADRTGNAKQNKHLKLFVL